MNRKLLQFTMSPRTRFISDAILLALMMILISAVLWTAVRKSNQALNKAREELIHMSQDVYLHEQERNNPVSVVTSRFTTTEILRLAENEARVIQVGKAGHDQAKIRVSFTGHWRDLLELLAKIESEGATASGAVIYLETDPVSKSESLRMDILIPDFTLSRK